jgi:dTDP-4-dehydrorhamnose reductase
MKNKLIIGPASSIAKSYIDYSYNEFNNIFKFSLSNQNNVIEILHEQICKSKFDSVLYFSHIKPQPLKLNIGNSKFINVELPIKLSQICQLYGTQFLVFSSTRIFSEKHPFIGKNTNYSPETYYGQQKVDLELGVLGYNAKVLRLTKVIAPNDELWLNWYKSISTGTKTIVYRDKFISPVFLKEVVGAIDIVLNAESGGIFQFSRDIEISYEKLFKEFLKYISRKDNVSLDLQGVEFATGNLSHASLECDKSLKQCIGEFDSQFEEFIKDFI